MSEKNLDPLSINELLKHNFFIPSYQRGYRWKEKQVLELLNDISDFKSEPMKDKDDQSWYCLQPLAVKKCDDSTYEKYNLDKEETWYEVIDGQQRLTTIYLILHYINQGYVENRRKKLFKINYATRENSQAFLISNLDENKVDDTNIDFYHITTAYKTIHQWFSKPAFDFDLSKFESKFSFSTKVIWYEVEANSKSYEIFIRLNVGKIDLTNSELIRALFLKKWNSNEAVDKLRLKQLQISSEWDTIENTLQDDAFWYFIYNIDDQDNPKYANRIEYIFDLMKEKPEGAEEKFTYYRFDEEFDDSIRKSKNGIPDADAIWLKVKKYFLTFQEWYNDRELYHLIGFLIATDYDILDLIKPKRDNIEIEIKTKTEFKSFLVEEIKQIVNCEIRKLTYKDAKVKPVLLLFNIETILSNKQSNLLFPFNLYKTDEWEIEHIRSQTDKDISGKDRIAWAKDMLEFFTGQKKIKKQEEFIDLLKDNKSKIFKSILEQDKIKSILLLLLTIVKGEKLDDLNFNMAYNKIRTEFNEDNEPSNCAISNLALLDATTNRSYKNAFFPIKRKIILENDKTGTFVPICTKNVFTKAYSKKFDEIMYWNKFDAEDYISAIEDTLSPYLNDEKEETHE